jgi:hypothetical protein
MQSRMICLTLVVAALAAMAPITPPAEAASRTWVSGSNGSDGNPCTRAAPCATFFHTLSQTDAFGEINCIDAGSFGGLVIDKSVTISCEGGTAGILGNLDGMIVSVAATDSVYLKGLDIEGLGPNAGSQIGIDFKGAGTLHVEKCRIHGFSSTGSGFGIFFRPSGNASLFVADTVVADNGSPTGGGGILVQPFSGSSLTKVSLERVRMTNNNFGLKADGSSAGSLEVSVTDSLASGNSLDGVYAITTGGHVDMMVSHSTASNNGDVGFHANGANVQVLLDNSIASGNGIGVFGVNRAILLSYQSNKINLNGKNGTPLPSIAMD